jgi:hypothetical protein
MDIDSAVKLPGEAKQNNRPPECGQPIDAGDLLGVSKAEMHCS